jgi:uncharacterized protein involved in oxidation of intracellular sulfur
MKRIPAHHQRPRLRCQRDLQRHSARALGRREDAAARVCLMGDAVTCAKAGEETPNGYYTLDRMLKTFPRHGGQIACCGT